MRCADTQTAVISPRYLSQWDDSLHVGVADVEVRHFLRLPGGGLQARRVLHGPVQRLGGHQVDHVVHLELQLHHLVGRAVQSGRGGVDEKSRYCRGRSRLSSFSVETQSSGDLAAGEE